MSQSANVNITLIVTVSNVKSVFRQGLIRGIHTVAETGRE
jgi:hypothetical protein